METVGIHQSGDQAKRQIVPIDGMGSKQRPAGLKLDGPEAVEFDRGLPVPCKGSIRILTGLAILLGELF